jgi:nucleoside phosphorylase
MKNLLFITAFPEETQSVLKFFKNLKSVDKKVHSAQYANCCCYHLETGMGFQNAEYSVKKFLKLQWALRHVYIVGFCGGLDETLEVGQTISATKALLFQEGSQKEFQLQTVPDTTAVEKILTIDKIIRTAKEKKDLFHQSQAQVVDMEAGMVAFCFQNAGVPVSVVKAVMDSGEQELPQNLRNPLAEEKNLLVELKNNMKMAKERLEKDFLEGFFDRLEAGS